MKIIHNFDNHIPLTHPVTLTIGNFDGVHLGHQFLIERLKKVADENNIQSVVVSFENHPQSVITANYENHSICTLAHKLKLLESGGVDLLLLLQFNQDIKKQSAEEFLTHLYTQLPFSHLILGYDAVLGNNREGTKDHVIHFAKHLNIEVEYLEPFKIDHQPVSSSLIRKAIKQGQLKTIKMLLGRNYSIFGKVIRGLGQGKALGFPTANIDVSELNLPPLGVYAVEVEYENKRHKGIVNLGVAPTMRESKIPVLEIHLLDKNQDLYGKELNVIFYGFIRPEILFSTTDALKKQIKDDIDIAHSILK